MVARPALRVPENVSGEFFVDSSCIDCDACRQIAPATFADSGLGRSFVHRQPQREAERRRALMALVACPTASIGTSPKADASPGVSGFPERIAAGVYYCGFTSASSFGASSYLIQRPEGNVLVDSPRAAGPLLERIAELGGVRWMFLTHRDDVADHRAFRQRFGCERLLHRADISRDTADIEIPFDGGEIISLAPDLRVVPVPGHTRGSAALLYRDTFLFTGDHLWGTEDGAGLSASRAVCWYSWAEQLRSLERLLEIPFQWVLPGHGRQLRVDSTAAMHHRLGRLLARLRAF